MLPIIGGNCHNCHFCRHKSFVRVCRDKTRFFFFFATKACYSFVATNICRDKCKLVATKLLSRQADFCRDKHVFCLDKSMLFKYFQYTSNKVLSRQAYFCRNKRRILSRQKRVCCDKTCGDKNDTCGSSRVIVTRCSHPLPLYPTACLLSQTVVLHTCSLRCLAYLRGSQAESNESLLPGKQCC